MLLVAVILMVVTACVTIVSTYFLLNAEDYRWRWSSFMSGASVALYVYLLVIHTRRANSQKKNCIYA